jgi:hypothetical protein
MIAVTRMKLDKLQIMARPTGTAGTMRGKSGIFDGAPAP